MAHFAIKLQLVLWKNYLIWKRHYVISIIEILMPILIFSMLSLVHNNVPAIKPLHNNVPEIKPPHNNVPEIKPPPNNVPQIKPIDIVPNGPPTRIPYYKAKLSRSLECKLLYTPNYPSVNGFMDKIPNIPDKEGFATEKDMEESMLAYFDKYQNETDYSIPVGVVFENFPTNELPKNLKYKIRTDSRLQVESLFDYESRPIEPNSKDSYFEKFIPTQYALDIAFIEQTIKPERPLEFDIKLQEIPFTRDDERPTPYYILTLNLWIILAFVFIFSSLLIRIIEEKSTGVKEFTKMMGLDAWMIWLGWYLYSMVINIIVITIITLTLSVNMSLNIRLIYGNCDPSIIWIFLFIYCSASVCLAFFISTLFNKPTLGMCVGTIIWLVTYFSRIKLNTQGKSYYHPYYRYFIIVWPNVWVPHGFITIRFFEADGGLTWSKFFQIPSEESSEIPMYWVFLWLIIHCIIFLILTWYIANIFPGEYGIARSWKYPFTVRMDTEHYCRKV